MRRLIALALLSLGACGSAPDANDRARSAIASHCGSCHVVPGVQTARGQVGPDLSHVGSQEIIAGTLPNNRANMIRWITSAQSVSPGSAMPDIPMSHGEAAAVADYLASLK